VDGHVDRLAAGMMLTAHGRSAQRAAAPEVENGDTARARLRDVHALLEVDS
jgi:hypothetical protein